MPSAFIAELRDQLRAAERALREARRAGDELLVDAMRQRLADLAAIAHRHGTATP